MKRWQWLVVVMFSVLGAVAHAAPFYASKDGSTVWDEATGLVWARCSLGQKWTGKTCVGDASKHTFEDAQAAAKRFNAAGGLGGVKDWVVPAIRQLVSLRSCSTGLISDLRDLQDNGEQVQKSCADKPVQPTIDPLPFRARRPIGTGLLLLRPVSAPGALTSTMAAPTTSAAAAASSARCGWCEPVSC